MKNLFFVTLIFCLFSVTTFGSPTTTEVGVPGDTHWVSFFDENDEPISLYKAAIRISGPDGVGWAYSKNINNSHIGPLPTNPSVGTDAFIVVDMIFPPDFLKICVHSQEAVLLCKTTTKTPIANPRPGVGVRKRVRLSL